MKWPAKQKRIFALTGDTNGALLTELISVPQRRPRLKVISRAEGSAILNKDNLKQLLGQAAKALDGRLAIALPLGFFEIVNLTLPVMPRETVGQALPYHLTKNIGQPLSEYVYDWQITRHDKERLRITAYLFPAATFKRVQAELEKKGLELAFLESDAFAAFAFLDLQERLKSGGAALCVLIWKNSISLAIYENRVLSLVRSVALNQPDTPYAPSQDRIEGPAEPEIKVSPASGTELAEVLNNPANTPKDYIDEDEVDSILENFALLSSESEDKKEKKPAPARQAEISFDSLPATPSPARRTGDIWSDYLNQINLEVVRTKDYYISVIQGPMIQQVFVGGADQFMPKMRDLIIGKNVIRFEPLIAAEESTECPALLSAISLGTGAGRQ